MKKFHTLKIMPNSMAEEVFITELAAVCEDGVRCCLGEPFGKPYNEFIISQDDYERIRDYLIKK